MVYNQRFVVCILVNGQIIKEANDDSVEIPFGCEYVIRLRNKHKDRRAVAKLFIDGEEQSNNGYVVQPNSFVDIERNSHVARKFKFVESTSIEAQAAGKDKKNVEKFNGVIEARFYLEKEQPKPAVVHHHHHYPRYRKWVPNTHPYIPYDAYDTCDASYGVNMTYDSGGSVKQGLATNGMNTASETSTQPCNINSLSAVNPPKLVTPNESVPGVTVEGSYSSQTFRTCNVDVENDFVAVKLFLRGFVVEKVSIPNIIQSVLFCDNCGSARGAGGKANFCSTCGHKF